MMLNTLLPPMIADTDGLSTCDTDVALWRHRYYDSGIGRFTTLDTFEGQPTDPITLNKYIYGGADPVNMIDPSGQFSIPEVAISLAINASIAGAISGVTIGTVNGVLSAEDNGSFWTGFGGGLIDGFTIGASLFAAFDVGGPAGVAKALAVGTLQGGASMSSKISAEFATHQAIDDNQLRQAFLDGFAGGVASVGLGGGFSEAFGLTESSVADLALKTAVSGLTASITDLVSGFDTGESARVALAHALFAGGVNAVLTIFGQSFAASNAGAVEGTMKEVLAEGIGFVVGVPVGTLLDEPN